MGLYVRDEWKVSNRVTLNLGLRYDTYWTGRMNRGMQNGFDWETGDWLIGGGGIPAWLSEFPASAVLCGYDSDEPGQLAAEALQRRHPDMRRLRPPRGKDRNELLHTGS